MKFPRLERWFGGPRFVDMDDDHLTNAIRMLDRRRFEGKTLKPYEQAMLDLANEERERRAKGLALALSLSKPGQTQLSAETMIDESDPWVQRCRNLEWED